MLAALIGIPVTALTLYAGDGNLHDKLEFLVFIYFMGAVFTGAMGLSRGTRPTSVDYGKTISITMMSENGTGKELRSALDRLYLAETDLYACAFMSGVIFFILAMALIAVLQVWK